jgi:D-alanyl-D-alanine carboxypeptidase/D-alanyl-D-alanine-endopeptidase (penicillin-binding protein 4)
MKWSNNHGMECLLKRVGAVTTLSPGSWANGTLAVRNFLQTVVGLDVSAIAVEDGSGASRYSMVTPAQLTRLLGVLHDSFNIGPEFVAALPIGGVDGTLGHRMLAPSLHARVRAKTGSMTGVSNLAGFLETEDGERLAFAILMDAYPGSVEPLRRLQDDILLLLSQPAN